MKISFEHDDEPGTENKIYGFIHCRQCLSELPDEESPRSWARHEIGVTPDGIQVWCVRHDRNVDRITIHIEESD